jgi:hypothetical protein
MKLLKIAGIGFPVALAAGAALAVRSYRSAMAEAGAAWGQIEQQAAAPSSVFDPAMVAHQPEVARRYFSHAIAPGTPLRTTVELDMRGTFLLGDRDGYQTYKMNARQILAPPNSFVWLPRMNAGPVSISGSDALFRGSAWTRFWLMQLLPVANERGSADLARSATFRSTMEGIWAPASLLPQNNVGWEQIGPNEARVTVRSVTPSIELQIKLAADGAVREIVGMRWSNANREKRFRLQPFGGAIEAERSFDGFTIPAKVAVGNHYGTDEFLPFFQAEITHARFR